METVIYDHTPLAEYLKGQSLWPLWSFFPTIFFLSFSIFYPDMSLEDLP